MMVWSAWVTEPLQVGFFVRGLVAAVLVLVAGSMLGFGVLTRRSAYLGQGVSQSMLAGVALGSLAGITATPSAFLGAGVAAMMIAWLSRVKGLGPEAAVAVVSSAGLSIGVAVISADRSRGVNLTNLLFGNVLGVTWSDIALLSVATGVAVGSAALWGRKLALSASTPQVARAHGVAVRSLELGRVLTLSLVTAAAVQVVGVTLVVAALVLPAAVAALLTRTLGGAHIVAVGTAVLTGVLGLYVSYWMDIASGPAVVLAGSVLYAVTLAVTHKRR